MASIAAGLLAKVIVSLTISGNRLSLSFHYAANSVIPLRELDSLCDKFGTEVLPALRACMSTEVKIESIEAHCVLADTAVPGTNYLSGIVGTKSGESLPSNVGAVVQMRQTEISSKHNGRVTLPGIVESVCVDNLLTEAFINTEIDALATALLVDLVTTSLTWKLCVVQRWDVGVKITPLGWLVTTVRGVRNMGTQRRRTTELREFHP